MRAPVDHRNLKDTLYAAWADTAKALASPKRLELLEVLAQGERTVEVLAREAALTVNNTSSHLTVLKSARLVETRKQAQFVYYRIADQALFDVLLPLQALTRRRLREVDHLIRTYFEHRDALEPVDRAELRRRLKAGEVTLIDVRPAAEYNAGHIAGALSVPLQQLNARVGDLPRDRMVVAYCRGPYCVMAAEAVERVRKRGLDARRFADGLPGWRLAGYPVETGPGAAAAEPEDAASSRRRRRAS
ncbi:MAG: ArsR family transcriptional regulator [Gemmatimonadetes bacterium]|nr:ArsR family transcriptional regulator [Gemmatimonadota bacterium]